MREPFHERRDRAVVLASGDGPDVRAALEACRRAGWHAERAGTGGLRLRLDAAQPDTGGPVGVALCVEHAGSPHQALAVIRTYEAAGVRCVNGSSAVAACSDPVALAAALRAADVPVAPSAMALDAKGVRSAAAEIGCPLWLTALTGGWSRWSMRAADPDIVRAILSRRTAPTGTLDHVYHLQRCLAGGGRAVRLVVIDGETVAVDERTVAPRGGARTTPAPIDAPMVALGARVARAVKGSAITIAASAVDDEHWVVERVQPRVSLTEDGRAPADPVVERLVDYLTRLRGSESP